MSHCNELFHYNKLYRSDLVITGTKSSLYVEEFFEFSDKLSGPENNHPRNFTFQLTQKHTIAMDHIHVCKALPTTGV